MTSCMSPRLLLFLISQHYGPLVGEILNVLNGMLHIQTLPLSLINGFYVTLGF